MKRVIRIKYRLLRFFSKLLIVLLLLLILYNYIPIKKGDSSFYISSSNAETVLSTLKTHGYSVLPVDRWILHLMHTPPKGWYLLQDIPQTRFAFFDALRKNHDRIIGIKLYAGETSQELSKRLAHDLKLNFHKILKSYQKYSQFSEGDILAGYYHILKDLNEEETIKLLYRLSNEKLNHFMQHHTQTKIDKKHLKKLLIVASIIQKETNDKEEMKLVASVISNRLKKGMKLQMDGTLNYGKYAHTIVTHERIRDDNSSYNTYKHKGLPPAPLATVSIEALKAALSPAQTDYLFFMLTPSGKHHFATTYKEHLANIHAFREAQEAKKRKKSPTKVKKEKNHTPKKRDKNQTKPQKAVIRLSE